MNVYFQENHFILNKGSMTNESIFFEKKFHNERIECFFKNTYSIQYNTFEYKCETEMKN